MKSGAGKKIVKPRGRFSRDGLQFARNVIEDSAGIAKEALKAVEEKSTK